MPVTRDEVLADLRLAGGSRDSKIRNLDDLAAELALRRSRGQTVQLAEQDEPTEHTELTWIDRDAGHALLGLLNTLDPIKRATFHLHHVEDLTAAEIGEVLGEPRAKSRKSMNAFSPAFSMRASNSPRTHALSRLL